MDVYVKYAAKHGDGYEPSYSTYLLKKLGDSPLLVWYSENQWNHLVPYHQQIMNKIGSGWNRMGWSSISRKREGAWFFLGRAYDELR